MYIKYIWEYYIYIFIFIIKHSIPSVFIHAQACKCMCINKKRGKLLLRKYTHRMIEFFMSKDRFRFYLVLYILGVNPRRKIVTKLWNCEIDDKGDENSTLFWKKPFFLLHEKKKKKPTNWFVNKNIKLLKFTFFVFCVEIVVLCNSSTLWQ